MKNQLVYADYKHCLTNVACSILHHFGLPHKHSTLPLLDGYLQKKDYKNIVLLLYDGLGSVIIKKNLADNSFLARHIKGTISSVFPPTTAAATTSLLSGLNPCEHGRVGYHVYIKELDEVVTIFENVIKDTEKPAAAYSVMDKFLGYDGVAAQINRLTDKKAHLLFPFGVGAYADLDDMCGRIKALCRQNGKKYIYAYCTEPDHSEHDYGTSGPEVTPLIQRLDKMTEQLAGELENTLLIVLADHGHFDVKPIALDVEYPDFCQMLTRNTAVEGRACAFWVAPENHERFQKEFERLFGNDFILLTKQEVLAQKLFGDGEACANFAESIGDFLAIAVGDKYFERYQHPEPMVSYHAGLVADEMLVPLIVVEK